MDIGKAFSYVFQDESWVTKVLLGGVIALIPLIGQIVVIGYMLKTAQNVMRGSQRPLPEWNEFGDHLVRGLYGFVIQIVYYLPVIVLYFLVLGITAFGAAATTDAEGQGGAGALVGVCLFPLLAVLALVCAVAAYGGMARYLASGTLSDAFKFGEVFGNLRANLGAWVMFLLVLILASIVASVGIIACGIGVLFTAFYAQLVNGHALGQTALQTGLAAGTTEPPSGYGPPPTVV